MKKIKCRKISKGVGEGVSLVSNAPISFLGDVDPKTGLIVNKNHPLYGKSIEGKVLIFPTGRGSTVGSYILYQLSKNGKAPKAIIMKEAEPIIAVGAIISNIPLVDKPEVFEFKDGERITVDADHNEIIVH
ncbi:MAG: DUF126 domain-containing protein [Nitrososphaerota archaeon]|nr:DUF126 domain-containing protein [Nitrososphaerales archaeon]MCX8191262.1 DUF126 domain-containing protein [Nitrososphaerales archaeon]MDW8044321.1 DUF126 domain-containing protein [Nitrososphaerota archaeon]